MTPATRAALVGAGAATAALGAGLIAAGARARTTPPPGSGPRSHAVTVNRPLEDVRAGLPEPLAALGGGVDVELRPAPGGRGTEIHVTPREGGPSGDDVREALRRGRALLEAGGPVTLEPVPHGRRTPTPGGLVLDAVTRRSQRKGLA